MAWSYCVSRFKTKLLQINKFTQNHREFLQKKYFCTSANSASSSNRSGKPTFLYIRIGNSAEINYETKAIILDS